MVVLSEPSVAVQTTILVEAVDPPAPQTPLTLEERFRLVVFRSLPPAGVVADTFARLSLRPLPGALWTGLHLVENGMVAVNACALGVLAIQHGWQDDMSVRLLHASTPGSSQTWIMGNIINDRLLEQYPDLESVQSRLHGRYILLNLIAHGFDTPECGVPPARPVCGFHHLAALESVACPEAEHRATEERHEAFLYGQAIANLSYNREALHAGSR